MRNHRLVQVLFCAQQVTNLELVNFLQSNLSPQLGQPINLRRKSNVECLPAVLSSFVGEIVEVQRKYSYKYFLQLDKKMDCRIDSTLLHLILVPTTLAAALSVTQLCSILTVRLM